MNRTKAINNEIVGPIENEHIQPGEKPIGVITRKLASAGTKFSVVIARLSRPSLSSEDIKMAELEKVTKVNNILSLPHVVEQ